MPGGGQAEEEGGQQGKGKEQRRSIDPLSATQYSPESRAENSPGPSIRQPGASRHKPSRGTIREAREKKKPWENHNTGPGHGKAPNQANNRYNHWRELGNNAHKKEGGGAE